jgi:cellulose synthase/poly-beta-1,6-N-acetylglucosamine synthase-like glycosyltransferase
MYIYIQSIILILQIFLTIAAAYLLLLTAAAWLGAWSKDSRSSKELINFLILIPAHNEEHLIHDLLENLESIDYPADHFSVHVVADNCTDKTAQIVQEYRAELYERTDEVHTGKGYALQWGMDNLRKIGVDHDAIVIIDADSVISENYLKVMAAHLAHGERVIQSYYSVRNPENSFAESMRFAALAVLHYLRPLGRMKMGGSVGLKGNGMVFDRELIERYSWPTSITEDIELHMELLLDGEIVTFAPNAEVRAEMPDTLTSTHSQASRWDSGRLEMSRRYIFPLIQSAWSQLKRMNLSRTFVYFDALMEYVIPPFTVLFGLSILTFILSSFAYAAIAFRFLDVLFSGLAVDRNLAELNFFLSMGILLALLIYLLSGLIQVRAPLSIYIALLKAPKYMVWKVMQYTSVFLKRKSSGWVRTTRNEG